MPRKKRASEDAVEGLAGRWTRLAGRERRRAFGGRLIRTLRALPFRLRSLRGWFSEVSF